MNMEETLKQYDSLFGRADMGTIEEFLTGRMEAAIQEGDLSSVITLVNELIGFCRDTSQSEKGISYCNQLIALLKELNLAGTVPYATSALNIANAFRAFGLLWESLECYQTVESIYRENLEDNDFRYASLYNNWSLLYQEMGQFSHAKEASEKALAIVVQYEGVEMELATTHTNLAASLLRLEKSEEAMLHLKLALDIYEADGGKDFHYSAALSAMGDARYLSGQPEEAVLYYRKAMAELEKHVGRTEAYERIAANCKLAEEKITGTEAEMKQKNAVQSSVSTESESIQKDSGYQKILVRSRKLYERYGAPMIHEFFPEWEQEIAVGLVGEGSDCFGYDDAFSGDHDEQPGFCMWVTETVYEQIGEKLQLAYEAMVKTVFPGQQVQKKRRGVMVISEFYEDILGRKSLPSTVEEWCGMQDAVLAAATNGEVFRDDKGVFLAIRQKLSVYYTDKVWRIKLAEEMTYFSQYGQYNYPRMMARKDYVTARLCLGQWMQHTMSLVYLLNRKYAPYYKWMREGIRHLEILPQIGDILDAVADMPDQRKAWERVSYSAGDINGEDQIALTMEITAGLFLDEMQRQGLLIHGENYLAAYAQTVIAADVPAATDTDTGTDIIVTEGQKRRLVDEIVSLEWRQFQDVKNEGGRADCQDDWSTFQIMRKSQYLTWPKELLASYLADLICAEEQGWNLIMEKYARMMASTAPEEYAALKASLPVRSTERIRLQEQIIQIQVSWMEEFATLYPQLAGNARSIHTCQDTPWNTSYETYLRGELGTYSRETLSLYGRFIAGLAQKQQNLAYQIMNNTALLYGYTSLEAAEKALSR